VGIDIKDPFIHEAAHALVYDALDIRIKKVWVEEDGNGVSWGMAERGVPPLDLPPALLVMEFMAGAAALVKITRLPFDRVIKKTTSDFCTVLKYLKSSCEKQTKHNLLRLEMAARGFVSEWIDTHKQLVIGIASEVQKRQVGPGRYELEGDSLHLALKHNWHLRPSVEQVTVFAEQGWAMVHKMELSEARFEWHDRILAHYASMIEP
jgi:hypothetical protein